MTSQNPAVVMDKWVLRYVRLPHAQALGASLTVGQRYGILQTRYVSSWSRCSLRLIFPGFAGNDAPSFVFPTAIATKGGVGGSGGSGSGRPAIANKPSYLTGGAGSGGSLSAKRGTEDLDFFIGDEALTAASGPGTRRQGSLGFLKAPPLNADRLWHTLPSTARTGRKLGMAVV